MHLRHFKWANCTHQKTQYYVQREGEGESEWGWIKDIWIICCTFLYAQHFLLHVAKVFWSGIEFVCVKCIYYTCIIFIKKDFRTCKRKFSVLITRSQTSL